MKEFAVSFEFFPPKTAEGHKNLQKTALQLAKLNPQFFSVTYGAGGSARGGTLEAVKMVQQATAAITAPHISCLGLTRAEILSALHAYQAAGAKRIVALRGDAQPGVEQTGELHYANELVAFIRETTGDHFHIEVAAYPEFHPQAKNSADDITNLKRKVTAGANSAITQYFYNPDAYFYFLDECAKQQIFIPVVPGIMPISCFVKLARFSHQCGAEIPSWIRKRLTDFGDDTASIQAFGLDVVHNLCNRLIAGGAPGLHFYTLNQAEPTLSLYKMITNSHPEIMVRHQSEKFPLSS